MPNIFFTSDQHYDSPSIIRVCNRPFVLLEEMNETMIQRHNEVVRPGDLVYNLGDMFLGKRSGANKGLESAKSIRKRLNGQQYLIEGNHDELAAQMPEAFVWIRHYARLHSKGLPDGCPDIVLCHYALRTWEKKSYGSWHLYGHSHGNLPEDDSLSFDAGVDCWDFRPVSIEEVAMNIKRIQKMNIILGTKPKLDHLPEGSY